MKERLNWDYFNWKEFQRLCIEIAEMIFPDCDFSEYLKQGQKQDGIDLIGFKRSNGKFICIQCKKEKKLIESDVSKIIADFRTGVFSKTSSDFILVTSADLQNTSLQKFITTSQLELYNQSDLTFDCWDVHRIEKHLRNRFDLVRAYFGESEALDFCYPELRYEKIQTIEPVPNYIARRLIKFRKEAIQNDSYWDFSPIATFDLLTLLTKDKTVAKRICIVGDAYHGKSSYIKHTILQLQKEHPQLFPIFLQIKEYSVQSIAELLSTIFGEWRKIPLRDIILVIDGLDEVPTEKFTEMVSRIKEFAVAYFPVSIVFSCRKLFYTKYNVEGTLPEFETYDLYNLQYNDIKDYIRSVLGNLADAFEQEASLKGIGSLLFHPFYLINITDHYSKPPHQLPGSKASVIDSLISRSFDVTKYRKLKGSESVNDEVFLFNNVVEKFAFALQLAGTNSFTTEDISQLFTGDERLLLQHNSLITHSDVSWSFVNALFQEHIAARKLAKLPYEDILAHCAVGVTIKKVRTKWIQTLSSLLTILDSESNLFSQIFRFIENDNIELLFQTEGSKYSDELKLSLLKKLLDKCVRLNIRTLIVTEGTVGQFIQPSNSCKDYLLELLSNKEITITVKVVCCRILRHSLLSERQIKYYGDFVLSELADTSDTYYAANMIQVLSIHKFGDCELINKISEIEFLNNSHEFRDEVYELISVLNLTDKFYYYGLNGVPFLIEYNKEISHGGSEHNLQEFLLNSTKPANLSRLILRIKEDDWLSYYERHSITGKDFFKRLFEKLALYFDDYPYMIFSIAAFVKSLGRKYLRHEFKEIDNFLDATNSHWLLARILKDSIFKDNDWESGALISHECYDYLLFEFEDEGHDNKVLWNCISALRYKHKNEIADTFYSLCVDITEGTIINKEGSALHEKYQEAEKRKLENDLTFIQSVQSFKAGIINYFRAYGKNNIPDDDLYVEVDTNVSKIRISSDSYFLYHFLSGCLRGKKKVQLKECLKRLEHKGYFEIFQAEEIIKYFRKTEDTDKILLPILRDYYNKNVASASFKNCLWMEGNMFHWKTKEYRIGEIFKKFEFDTEEAYLMEFVWLDTDGIRSIQNSRLNKQQSISQLILNKISAKGKAEFRKKIVQNIKDGIKHESVLGTHIGLCKHLKITEAKDCILDCIKSMKNEYVNKSDTVDIYIELGGERTEVLSLLKDYTELNSYIFGYLIEKLYKTFPDDVTTIIRKALSDTNISYENRIKYNLFLVDLGDLGAFSFLANEVRLKLKSPYHIQGGHSVTAINTRKALTEISDLMYLLVDENYNDRKSFHDSAKSILLEWLNTLAAKNEADLIKVIKFLDKAMQILSKQYEMATDLNWYANRMIEDFRGSDKTVKTLLEIKKILNSIEAF
jgi:hypothetical protein